MNRFIINSKEVKRNCLDAVMEIRGEDNLEVVIQKHKKRKTDEQRSWFHVLASMLGEETGYTLAEVKDLVKRQVIGTRYVTIGNSQCEVVESSESQNREIYSQLIEGVYQLAAEAGIELPPARWNG